MSERRRRWDCPGAADVLINYSKSKQETGEIEAACREAGADTLLMQGNVADDDDDACRAMAQAGRALGRLGGLVNSACILTLADSANSRGNLRAAL